MLTKRTMPARARPLPALAGTSNPERMLRHAGFAARVAAAAILAAMLAYAALCSPAVAFAQEDTSASVGITLSPIETIEREEASAPGAGTGSHDTPASIPTSGSTAETTALPRTGDQSVLAIGALLLAALAAGAVLRFGRPGQPAKKMKRRGGADNLLGIVLATCLVTGATPASAAQAIEADDAFPLESSQPAPSEGNSTAKAIPPERQDGPGRTGEADMQAIYVCDNENAPESSKAQGAAPGQSAPSEPIASPLANALPLASASPLALQRSYIDWGDYSYQIIGDPIIGQEMSIQFTPGPEIDDSIQPVYTWYYTPFETSSPEVVISRTASAIIPEKALGMKLRCKIEDAQDRVDLTLIFVIGACGYELTGSTIITGQPISGSTLRATFRELPVDCSPKVTWYSGARQNTAEKYLGQGTSLRLNNTMVGKYITVWVEDASHRYVGRRTATIGPVQKERPNAPDILETTLSPNGTLSVLCRTNSSPEQQTSSISLECKGANGQWREIDRKTPPNIQATCEVDFSADLSEEFRNGGSIFVRAVSRNQAGTSATSSEHTVSAQIGITVPLSLECRVAGDGSVSSEIQLVQNTGTLNMAIERIETTLMPGMEADNDWTCFSDGSILFQGKFGSSAPAIERLVVAPGRSLPVGWSTEKVGFGAIEPSSTPMVYGTVTYVVSPALG